VKGWWMMRVVSQWSGWRKCHSKNLLKCYFLEKYATNIIKHACQKADNGKVTEMQSVTRSQLLRSVRSAPSRLVHYGVPAHLWHGMVGERRCQLKLSKTARRRSMYCRRTRSRRWSTLYSAVVNDVNQMVEQTYPTDSLAVSQNCRCKSK